uniref:DNA-(apurinic or apyrimidinic site) endonuclease n=1 Tax=Tetraodon nigroviridis TaxID=99883 RepID=H3C009_TETNG
TGLLTSHEAAVGCYGDQAEFCREELQLLDNEGRAVITQHKVSHSCEGKEKAIAVINVYCPRADPEKPERKQFKLQFYKLLQCRAEAILKDGSHVIVLGDINTSHQRIDHCDPSDNEDFDENPGRKWLKLFLHGIRQEEEENDQEHAEFSQVTSTPPGHGGKFVDTFRYFHPTRANAFTCWSTLTGARQTNYGTRIDYIFADHRLASEQFVAADIMPEVEGSDHCPVWGQLSCSLVPSTKPPPLCTRYLPEFAGKQQKLSHFFVKAEQNSSLPEHRNPLPGSQEEEEKRENLNPTAQKSGQKRLSNVLKGKKTKTVKSSSNSQGSLLSFFKPTVTNVVADTPVRQCELLSSAEENGQQTPITRLTPQPAAKKGSSSGFWKSVLHGPPPPPSCKVHKEPCVLRTVKKDGPNMGRQFFVCARPQGHASNPDARCNFFEWVDKGKGGVWS